MDAPHPSRNAPTSPKFVLGAQRASARTGEVSLDPWRVAASALALWATPAPGSDTW
jgi:hypothetical protein